MKMFYEEHLYLDDEISYILDGSGYFNMRDKEDRGAKSKADSGDSVWCLQPRTSNHWGRGKALAEKEGSGPLASHCGAAVTGLLIAFSMLSAYESPAVDIVAGKLNGKKLEKTRALTFADLAYVEMASAQDARYGQKDSSDQNFDYMFKLLIIGNSSVGKTSFLFRYADDSFTSAFVSTVGIDFKVKTVFKNEKRIKLQIWNINFASPGHGHCDNSTSKIKLLPTMIKAEESGKQEECAITSTAPVLTTEIPTTVSTMAAAAAANASASTSASSTVGGTVPAVPEPGVTSIVATVVDNENTVTVLTEEQAQLTSTPAVQDQSAKVFSNTGEETSKQETVADFTLKKEEEESQPAKKHIYLEYKGGGKASI
ncbi:hypothetical protein EI555_018647 [Monodon monoceros]|uniref:small monomeric GTPase n=2 Tax=Boreoeutheria TaxID=1437010 RepID=A0A4U1EG89_MONMO|nr:hypothetical protein EI555_018647 [Monodon monoceros]